MYLVRICIFIHLSCTHLVSIYTFYSILFIDYILFTVAPFLKVSQFWTCEADIRHVTV